MEEKMEEIISYIIILIITINVVYTIVSMTRFIVMVISNSVKIQILAPISAIIFGLFMYIVFGFNFYYYLAENSIQSLLSSTLCILMANEILIDTFYALNEKFIFINSKKLDLSKIQDIQIKKLFIFSFLQVVIIHIENKPQISFYISKKVKKLILEGKWFKGNKLLQSE